ncbi:MAG TPA: winged helix-turn-helix transcriptional regulator [Dissulfurispiraceae bacterium]|nr:winged helix-turn-helix transcriptional regulator [Dissulfurispiraceae bacterium]
MNTENVPDEISLRLLDEFAKEPVVSQRALAARLGIALGLVNSYIRRLYRKGHIKIKSLPKNRIKYIITPKGFTEKARLTYDYMNYSISYFRDIRGNIERTYSGMMADNIKNILLWGDGEIAELCYISTRGLPLRIVGIVSDKRIERGFFGHNVYTADDIGDLEYDAVLVSSIDGNVVDNVQSLDGKKVFYL